MDPISALTVATSAWDFLKDIYVYYQVWKGCGDDVAQLRVRLLALQATFGATKDALTRPGLSSENRSLVEEALRRCDPAVWNLEETLDKFKKNDGQPQTAWQKLKASGRKAAYPFQSSTVQSLMDVLEQCQRHLSTASILLGLNASASTLERMQALDNKLVTDFRSIEDSMKQLSLSQDSVEARILRELAEKVVSIHAAIDETQVKVETVLERLDTADKKRKAQDIIDSLDHEQLNKRRRAIAESHPDTLHWLLDPGKSEFARWLKSGFGMFWIKGKAGSGKSTLMKFISEQPETEDLLRSWAGPNALMMVEHFFWIAGSESQRSSHGFLQHLLHQVLQEDSEVIPEACERRWEQERVASRQWKTQELRAALQAAVEHTTMHICFLIDGLDEYDPPRDHSLLTEMLLDLSKHPHVKIIVSSRPWKVFETVLLPGAHLLLLENVNRRDIVRYTRKRLLEASKDQLLQSLGWEAIEDQKYWILEVGAKIDPMWVSLVYSVVNRAEGVFLWTSLVLDAICERIGASQSLDIIIDHVNDFPDKLEEYFRQLVFERIGNTWLSETAMMLRMAEVLHDVHELGFRNDDGNSCVGNTQFCAAWLLASAEFGKEFLSDSAFAEILSMRSILAEDPLNSVALVKSFIHSCCKDLLTVTEEYETASSNKPWMVDLVYAHRTVHDFVRTQDMQTLMNAHVPLHFGDGYLKSRLVIADIKMQPLRRDLNDVADAMVWVSMNAGDKSRCENMPAGLLREHGKVAVQMAKTASPGMAVQDFVAHLIHYLIVAGYPWYALGELQRRRGLLA